MSGALNNRSTLAWRVGTGATLLAGAPSCADVSFAVAIPATTADAVPMNSRRLIFICASLTATSDPTMFQNCRARLSASPNGDPKRVALLNQLWGFPADHVSDPCTSRRSDPGAKPHASRCRRFYPDGGPSQRLW